jgi:hypothetical protein
VCDFGITSSRFQAFAVWQWFQYLCSKVPAGKTPLTINLDETSVCLFPGIAKGTVFVSKRAGAVLKVSSRTKLRTCLTHVSFICNMPHLQPLLPQIIIGNDATFPKKIFDTLKATCPANTYLLRQTSAWNNIDTCVYIVRLLSIALREHMGELQPILCLDACRLHFAEKVITACTELGIWPLIIPAKMTGLLQPLDTHVFKRFKGRLKKLYLAARADDPDSDLDIARFLTCLYGAIRQAVQSREHSIAFNEDGLGGNQAQVSTRIKRRLQIDLPITVPSICPTDEQFKACFPQRAKFSLVAFLKPFFLGPVRPPRALPRIPADRLALALSNPLILEGPGRTRGEKREIQAQAAGAQDPTSAASSGPVPQTTRPRGAPIALLKRRRIV